MSYRCGIGEGMQALGFGPREPHIVCDGCGATHGVGNTRVHAAAWFLNGKSPPKWRGARTDDGKRTDWCPQCVADGKGGGR